MSSQDTNINFWTFLYSGEPQLPSVMGQSKDLSSLQLDFSSSIWVGSMLTKQQEVLMSICSNARTLASVDDNYQKSYNNSKHEILMKQETTRNFLSIVHCAM